MMHPLYSIAAALHCIALSRVAWHHPLVEFPRSGPLRFFLLLPHRSDLPDIHSHARDADRLLFLARSPFSSAPSPLRRTFFFVLPLLLYTTTYATGTGTVCTTTGIVDLENAHPGDIRHRREGGPARLRLVIRGEDSPHAPHAVDPRDLRVDEDLPEFDALVEARGGEADVC
jgi:hypothetical protein